MNKLILNKINLSDLADLQMGKRIRYIRELLQNEYGNEFSGKSVANRIQSFSQSTLTMIERGKTKDIPSTILYSISKDFGADLYMFFDDYYQQTHITTVELTPLIYFTDKGSKYQKSYHKAQAVAGEINPLLESEYTIKTTVSKIASNQDEQMTFVYKSRVKYSEQHLFYLLSQIINQINTLDVSINPELTESNFQLNSIKLAKDYITHGQTTLTSFPWFCHKDKLIHENNAFENAVSYTEELIKNHSRVKEAKGETNDE